MESIFAHLKWQATSERAQRGADGRQCWEKPVSLWSKKQEKWKNMQGNRGALTLQYDWCEKKWWAFPAHRMGEFQSWEHPEWFLQEVMGFSFPWPCWLCQIESYAKHRWSWGSSGQSRGRKNPQTSRKPSFSRDCLATVVSEECKTELTGGQEAAIKGDHSQQGCVNMRAIMEIN